MNAVRLCLPALLCAVVAAGCGGGGGGGGGGDGGGGGGPAPTGPVTISGKAQYQFPPPAAAFGDPCRGGLDFTAIELRPIRQATVQIINASSAVLDAGVTDDNGDFALTVDPGIDVRIRVRAELKRTGAPSWDVEVRDNTAHDGADPPVPALNQRALYVLDSAVFDSGTADSTRDVTAATGWTGTSYTATRAAAPFAILDTAYAGILLVLAADPDAVFEPLDVFWSVNNKAAEGEVDDGDIVTSFYSSNNNLFLLGDASADGDADEFDDHVVAHEWGHYFEDAFSRSDSIGGRHGLGDKLDMRVAFGEGWATALSGMALDNPTYCDTTLDSGFSIDIEGEGGGTPGWFNEISVMKIVYDLWDTAADGADAVSLGFGPIYNVMTGAQAATPAFTSIFTFATALKLENPGPAPLIDDLLEAEDIMGSGIDSFGGNETNDGDGNDLLPAPDVLPVYTPIVPDGSTLNICSNSQHDRKSDGTLLADGNKLSEHRFLRMEIMSPDQYTFEIITTNMDLPPDDPANDRDQSDPDIIILLNGVIQNQVVDGVPQGLSPAANEEIFTTPNVLAAGEYVMALVEFRYQDQETPADYPPQTCFDVTIRPAP